jgi:ABC-2 type transport system permease protein
MKISTRRVYAIVGERLQGTLEPILSTPVRREELLLGKALAAFVPSVVVAYAVFAVFIAIVELFAHPDIATAIVRGPDVIAQLVFTPLLAAWSIWVGIAVSARSNDPRAAGQVSVLVSLPIVAVTSLIAFNVIPSTLTVAVAFAVALVILDRIGWAVASAIFDRERLITNTK